MKRRKFVKYLGTISFAAGLFPVGFQQSKKSNHQTAYAEFSPLQHLALTEFENEQEEQPTLVTNGIDQSWLFSLRRLPYPNNEELISAFHYDGNKWTEQSPITESSGQYESLAAACALGGYPMVAFAQKDEDDWSIKVSIKREEYFSTPHKLSVPAGRSINPVLIAPDKNKFWIAWECFKEGSFSIYLSKFENGQWNKPQRITAQTQSCFNPALAEDKNGNLYVAYGISDGVHQNVEMKILDADTLQIKKTVPVAVGGGLDDRVNLNTNPALAFDSKERLWISWENNRDSTRLQDSDNYTGDRVCAMVYYKDGKIMQPRDAGKWLFRGKNDHLPTFIKDRKGRLFVFTHCGGDFDGNPHWKYRVSWLDPQNGWTTPKTILETSQKGQTHDPAVIFDNSGSFWLASRSEQWFDGESKVSNNQGYKRDNLTPGAGRVRLSKLELYQLKSPKLSEVYSEESFEPSIVEEHHPTENFFPLLSGRPKIKRRTMTHKGEQYILLLGNLHEHSEISTCWPAGCDGTLHDDYRYGMFAEGYDFMGMTDHAKSLTEVYWRKNLRMAEFYNDNNHFVVLPSLEWTYSNRGDTKIKKGAGHKNLIFPSTDEALKFIRNKDEVFSIKSPETSNAVKLWDFLHANDIDCVSIPHHPADETHPTDWEVHDEHYETVVEIFQCRGNAEYPGCPREINLERHRPIKNNKAFIDYALKDKKYQLGFIASGDHNSIGVGLAAVWVKEVSREGILEALKNRRCYATTGDKIFLDFKVNGAIGGESVALKSSPPEMEFTIESVQPVKSVEVLRNSQVIHTVDPEEELLEMNGKYTDNSYREEGGTLYYYLRVTQQNGHIGWSSPVFAEI